MKAVILDGVGQPYRLAEVPLPVPEKDEVLVRIKAASLNHRDLWIRKGLYAGLRFPSIQGSDGCGTVDQTGDSDSRWAGQEIIINPSLNWGGNPRVQGKDYKILGMAEDGTFAGYVKVNARLVHSKPSHLSAEEASCLPLGGLTAYRALIGRARAEKGEKVLVTGVGGGVAMLAMQFAIASGCHVFVTSGDDEKLKKAKELGAQGGVNYHRDDWHKQLFSESKGFDVIVDSACGDNFSKLVEIANPGGRIAFYGATLGAFNSGVPAKIFWKQLDILGSTMGNDSEFEAMVKLVNEKKVMPVVDCVFSLDEAEQAVQKMEAGKQFGKIVLSTGQ